LRGPPLAVALTLAWAAGCQHGLTPEEYLARERSFLRLGVDLDEEERSVRHVLAQRHLSVATEVRGPAFRALGAATLDGRLSAIRILSRRGVALAEDAAHDDLFAPGELQLLERFPTSLGEYELAAFVRIARGRDLGCAQLIRVLPDGHAVQAVLDVGELGPRACVAELTSGASGRLQATLGFPGLHGAGRTPRMQVELAFKSVPLGQVAPLVPVAKLAAGGSWLEAERARLDALVRPAAPFAERHALGVARAAVAMISGRESEAQVAAYRECIGRLHPASSEAAIVSDTLDYIERGWLDPQAAEPTDPSSEEPGVGEGDQVIAPSPAEPAAGESPGPDDEATIVEPP
jgi:hypothetical protein